MAALVEGAKSQAQGPTRPELTAPAWDRRRDRWAALLLFLFVWVVYLTTASYTVNQINDNRATTLMAWSLGTQGTIELPAQWRGEIPWEAEGVDGSLHTDRFPGAWLWAAPFHAAADAVLDRGVPPHPVLLNYAPSGVAAATATALGVVASFLVFRRLADRHLALAAAGVLAFATGVWSVSADTMWTHGLTHLTLTIALLAAASDRYVSSGLSFALAVITRPHTAVVAAVVGLWRGATRRSLRPTLTIGLMSAFGIVAMVLYSKTTFDTWLPTAGYDQSKLASIGTLPATAFLGRIAGTVGDPQRGILVFTPFLLGLLPFLPSGWRSSPWWVRSGTVGGLVYLLIQLWINRYTGGDHFFGSRLGLETLVLSSPLLLRTWQAHVRNEPVWRRVTVALVAVAFLIHALGATILTTTRTAPAMWAERIADACEEHPEHAGC